MIANKAYSSTNKNIVPVEKELFCYAGRIRLMRVSTLDYFHGFLCPKRPQIV